MLSLPTIAMPAITEITTIPQTLVSVVTRQNITRQTTRITLQQDSRQLARIATVKLPGFLPILITMACIFLFIMDHMKMSGINAMIAILPLAIIPYSVVPFVTPIQGQIMITRAFPDINIRAQPAIPATRMGTD